MKRSFFVLFHTCYKKWRVAATLLGKSILIAVISGPPCHCWFTVFLFTTLHYPYGLHHQSCIQPIIQYTNFSAPNYLISFISGILKLQSIMIILSNYNPLSAPITSLFQFIKISNPQSPHLNLHYKPSL